LDFKFDRFVVVKLHEENFVPDWNPVKINNPGRSEKNARADRFEPGSASFETAVL
jgi:hypothetical protein